MADLPLNRRVLALAVVALVVMSASPGLVAAQASGSEVGAAAAGGTIIVDQGETVSDLSGLAGTIIVRGTVTGDVSGLAGDVLIAQTGTVGGDVSVATGSLTIAGTVTGNVNGAAGNVLVTPSGTVGGDLSLGAGNVEIQGTVQGNAVIGAETITIAQGSVIAGDLRYDGHLTEHPASSVQGAVILDESLGMGPSPVAWNPSWRSPAWLDTVYGFFANLVLGAILLLVFPGFSRRVATKAGAGPARSAAIGFLLLVALPIALVLIAITIIGIPIALLGLFAFMLYIWVGLVYGEYAVGHWILARSSDEVNRWYALLLGLLLFALVGFIPWVGGLLVFIALLLGMGALGSAIRGTYRDRRGREPSPTDATTGAESGTTAD